MTDFEFSGEVKPQSKSLKLGLFGISIPESNEEALGVSLAPKDEDEDEVEKKKSKRNKKHLKTTIDDKMSLKCVDCMNEIKK